MGIHCTKRISGKGSVAYTLHLSKLYIPSFMWNCMFFPKNLKFYTNLSNFDSLKILIFQNCDQLSHQESLNQDIIFDHLNSHCALSKLLK